MSSMCCLQCDHPLVSGGSNVCPECGARFDPANPVTVGRLRNGRRVRERVFRPLGFLVGPITFAIGAPAMMLVLSVGGYGLSPLALILGGVCFLTGTILAVRQGLWFVRANCRSHRGHAALFIVWMIGSIVVAVFAIAVLAAIPIDLP